MAKKEIVTMGRKDGTVLKVSKENVKIFEKCGYKIKKAKTNNSGDKGNQKTN